MSVPRPAELFPHLLKRHQALQVVHPEWEQDRAQERCQSIPHLMQNLARSFRMSIPWAAPGAVERYEERCRFLRKGRLMKRQSWRILRTSRCKVCASLSLFEEKGIYSLYKSVAGRRRCLSACAACV